MSTVVIETSSSIMVLVLLCFNGEISPPLLVDKESLELDEESSWDSKIIKIFLQYVNGNTVDISSGVGVSYLIMK